MIPHRPSLRPCLTLALILGLGLLAPGLTLAAADDDLGRLFHTPERRAQLDEMRRRNIPILSQSQPTMDSIALQGIVRRSNGHTTLWINGQPVQDSGIRTHRNSIRVPLGNGQTRQLKVGEHMEVSSQSAPGDGK
ncbi:hypothetical protein [Uliginosibacterium gangwonense]|uniref:hypothetical protein n=1 Tax=Uliginosibacterium gangwonense TaxID=392736 RepID=UPI000376E694|nr:hypothetical protein [Uliginosibacterium gangwonense]